jgi:integrase
VHGVRCGDITSETITYRDRKNHDLLKTVTRHKFNTRFVDKYNSDDSNRLLLPPMTQQVCNRIIKEIAAKNDLTRGIRRGNVIVPMHKVIASHCFRASYGNLLFRIGVPTEMISEELGHAAMNVTIKHYLKFSERHEIIREKMNALVISMPSKESIKKSA